MSETDLGIEQRQHIALHEAEFARFIRVEVVQREGLHGGA